MELAELLLARPQATESAVLIRDPAFVHSKIFAGMLTAGLVPPSVGAALGRRPDATPPDGQPLYT